MDYLDKDDILIKKQFGFRWNHWTYYMTIIDLVDKVTSAEEKKVLWHYNWSWYIIAWIRILF